MIREALPIILALVVYDGIKWVVETIVLAWTSQE